ncbi:MAG: response regulator [Acidimicrobiales bacterium]
MPGATILVVDDDPVIQDVVQITFDLEGYDVITADDGVAGLERARAERPDLMILDVMMPRMNGIEVARAMKADPDTSSIPILMLSAKAQVADISAGGASGADDYMTKPFDPQELLDRGERLIRRSRER